MTSLKFYREDGPLGELCNFYPLGTDLVYNGKVYPTSEHLYQALKFLYPDASSESLEYSEIIRNAKTPYMSKLLGHQTTTWRYDWQKRLATIAKTYLDKGVRPRPNWEEEKVNEMEQVLLLKFRLHKKCQSALLSTNHSKLFEDSPLDDFWGSGKDGRGKNELGNALVRVRRILRKELAIPPPN